MPACSVVYCSSRTEWGIRLFSLPQGDRNEERRNTWIQNINRKNLPSNIYVCEKHFEEDQFENNRKDGRRPLKYNAIPTIFENKPILKVEGKSGRAHLQRSRRSLRILKPKTYDAYVSGSEDDIKEEKPKKKIKICGREVRCRACLAVIEVASAHLLRKHLLGKSIKDRILMFVPQLSTSLLDTEYICDKCCRLLTNFVRFYESCLDTEMKLKNGKISLIVEEKDMEESQEGKLTNSIKTQYAQQKVGRKRKQDLVSVREDNSEVQDNSEEIIQEEVVSRKRGRPKKVVPQDEIAEVEMVENAFKLEKKVISPNEESVEDTGDECEEISSSKDVINITDRDEETTLDVHEHKSISSKVNEKDIVKEEKENAVHRKFNLKESEENKSDDCDNKTGATTDHDYINAAFHCPECQTDYRTSKGMKNHLTTLHNILEEHEFHCGRCNMKFIRYKDMLKHKRTHGSPCDLCDKIFSNIDELKSHKNTHPEAYCCMKCGSVFEQEDKLTKHSLLHDAMTKVLAAIQKSLVVNSCETCGIIFPAKCKLLDHVKTVHLKIKDIKCPECEKLFSTKSLMSIHLRLKHSKKKSHKCDVCDVTFKKMEQLAHHRLTHNFTDPNRRTYGRAKDDPAKLRVYQCPFCFTTSSTKQLLITHLSIHANERKFECRYCGLKLSSERTQLLHEKTHEADPNSQFVCLTCKKRFPTEEDLKMHEPLHVPNIKQFSCCLCGAQFGREMMLENHLLDLHIKGPDTMNENVEESIKINKAKLKIDVVEVDDGREDGDIIAMNENIEGSIKINTLELKNDDKEVDGREEGEIIIQDVDEENVEVIETDCISLDGENGNNEYNTMEESINKATFIILNETVIYNE